jgi:O-methyltransferase involved in polyketide biosynthesis
MERNRTGKIDVSALTGVSETLLFCFYMKYLESIRPDGIINDPEYASIVDRIDYDFTLFDHTGGDSQLSLSCRSMIIDSIARSVVDTDPDITVVSFGSGIDFRYNRIDNGKIAWFDIDMPAVIDLRRQLYHEGPRLRFISCSALDHAWMENIPKEGKKLFIAEGLLMYFSREQVRDFITSLADRFPGSLLLFDVVSNFYINLVRDSTTDGFEKKMSSMWQWGINGWYEIESWDQRIRFVDEWLPMERYGDRASDPVRNILTTEDIPESGKEEVLNFMRVGLFQLGARI